MARYAAVGMYGPTGAGVAEHLDFEANRQGGVKGSVMDRVDIVRAFLDSRLLTALLTCDAD